MVTLAWVAVVSPGLLRCKSVVDRSGSFRPAESSKLRRECFLSDHQVMVLKPVRTGSEILASSFLFAIGCAGRCRRRRGLGTIEENPSQNSIDLGTVHQPANVSTATQFRNSCTWNRNGTDHCFGANRSPRLYSSAEWPARIHHLERQGNQSRTHQPITGAHNGALAWVDSQ